MILVIGSVDGPLYIIMILLNNWIHVIIQQIILSLSYKMWFFDNLKLLWELSFQQG